MNVKYFKNIKPSNSIKSYSKENLSKEFYYNKDELNNMILNSNLDNETLIK